MRPALLLVGATAALLVATMAQGQPADQGTSGGARKPGQPTGAGAGASDDADLQEIERALQADRGATGKGPRPASGLAAPAPASLPVIGGLVRTFQSFNPDISFIADVALAIFSDDDPLMSGEHDPTESGFNLQQLELAVSAMVDPYFRFDANILFSEHGVEIEEVYATTLSLPWSLQLRAGQFLTRFGRINATHPHSWAFVDQMLVLGKLFGAEGNRGLGAEISVLLPLTWYVELLASITNADGDSTARSFIGSSEWDVEGPQDMQVTSAAKQFFPLGENWSLAWGLSWATGPNATGQDNRTDIYGTDIYLKYRPITYGSYTILSLEMEWLLRRRQVPGDLLQDWGMYACLLWRFARRWAAAARYEATSGLDSDPLNPEWTDWRQKVSANITFWPTEFSRLRLQYGYDLPGWRSGYHAVFLAMEFAVGAHGAHRF